MCLGMGEQGLNRRHVVLRWETISLRCIVDTVPPGSSLAVRLCTLRGEHSTVILLMCLVQPDWVFRQEVEHGIKLSWVKNVIFLPQTFTRLSYCVSTMSGEAAACGAGFPVPFCDSSKGKSKLCPTGLLGYTPNCWVLSASSQEIPAEAGATVPLASLLL